VLLSFLPFTVMTVRVVNATTASPADSTTTERPATPSLSALDAYGDWIQVEPYGRAWRPTAVTPDWRPYTLGTWVNGPHGWTWYSELSWGAITYHYDRWTRYRMARWCWVPGETWSPAPVAWRIGGGFIGWAPLPPESDLAEQNGDIPDSAWIYVFATELDDGRMTVAALPSTMSVTAFASTSRPSLKRATLGP
jgi:hypothetical protein